jgi:asparagine synthetase B (glutamine-hydrolysing)
MACLPLDFTMVKHELFVARDRIGVKNFFIIVLQMIILFVSEIGAIQESGYVKRNRQNLFCTASSGCTNP